MQTSTRNLLGGLALLAFGLTSTVGAQVNQASPKSGVALEQSIVETPAFETFSPSGPVGPQSSVLADTAYYEDFANGIGGWTFENVLPDTATAWEYTTDVNLSVNNGDTRYVNPFPAPSAGNGFMFLDYPFFFTARGIDNPFVTGSGYIELAQNITSPNIDLTALDANVKYVVNFYSYQPTLNGAASRLIVSTEDASVPAVTIWQQVDEVNRPQDAVPGITISSPIPPQFIGLDNVQLTFAYQGDFYGWALDDILITELAPIEPQTNAFIAVAPNLRTPASQALGHEMAFVADVQNNGGEVIDMDLAISIFDENDMLIYTDTTRYADVETDSLRENQAFDNIFPLPTAEGVYTGIYEIFTERIDEDANFGNNQQSFQFLVGGDLYSKGAFASGTRPAGDDQQYSFTNIYYTPNLPASTDSILQIETVSFGMFPQNFADNDEAFVDLTTYAFRGDLNGDNIPQYGSAGDPDAEMILLASREFVIDTSFSEIPNGASVSYSPDEDGAVMLSADNDYIGFAVEVTYIPGSGGTNDDNVCFLGNTSVQYGGYDLAASAAGVTDSMSSVLNIADEPVFAFFAGSSPYIDANISYLPVVNSVKDLTPSEFAVRPNPATTQFAIDFNFGTAVDAQFEIINAVGQTVSTFNRDGLTTGAITIPTQGMNNGLYYVKVRTNDGKVASRKLLLQR